MKRDSYGADHESFRDSVRTFLDREVKPGWDKYIEAKQFSRDVAGLRPAGAARPRSSPSSRPVPVPYEDLGNVSMSLAPATAFSPEG